MLTSHWHATLDRPPLPVIDLPSTAEVVVVGAGVVGATTALWLTRAGLRPLVIDRSGPAAGATGHNGGILAAGLAENYLAATARYGHDTARALYALSLTGQRLMVELIEQEQIDCDLRLHGNLNFALGEAQLSIAAATVASLHADEFPATLLDRTAAQEFVRIPLGAAVSGARFNPAAGTVHSGKLVYGLLAAAQRYGAHVSWGATLQQIVTADGSLRLVTDRGTITTPAAVIAVNAWSGEVLPELAAHIKPVRGQVLCTVPVEPFITCGFGASLTATGEYGQQLPGGQVLFGGCRAIAPNHDVGVPPGDVSPDVQNALETGLGRLFPTLAGIAIERRWSGPMAFTADYLPIVTQPATGLFAIGGFSGHGMPFAAIVGRYLAEAVQTGTLPAALALLGMERATLL
ncbi:NAD(P)/FAD-dependent oxidoreductase [Chloroflexus aggregans]|uniref:FAD dependent oxidoreductase n=1 Tax=Chloroflexus aggregans (strain MD-66 / DSM 9485) TaxID=326427 RepID=B8G8Y8_CHLAD|nr:FAD-binding oxidoreductase [Chloroflexus aggregans]ACL26263.1 FAD dependent oxidoreductase [Chloroflexus aggregans DSM 9485]